jgi:hypothetical protein
MDGQNRIKPKTTQQANPHFGTFTFFQPQQAIAPKNAKEPKFPNRTTIIILTNSKKSKPIIFKYYDSS